MKQYINLLITFTWTDFKLKYIKTRIGLLWAILKPLVLLGTIYTIFSIFLGFKMDHYPLILLLGIILWNFFSESTLSSIDNLISKKEIIKRMPLPLSIIILSACINTLITAIINLLIFSCILIIAQIELSWLILLFPILLLLLFILSVGLSFILSALNIFFRDLRYIWEIILQLVFWATPVIYTLNLVPEKFLPYYLLNPLAQIINSARNLLLEQTLNLNSLLIILLTSLIFFLIGSGLLTKLRYKIIEHI